MKHIHILIIIALTVLTSGCTYFAKHKAKVENKIEERSKELSQAARLANERTQIELVKVQDLLQTANETTGSFELTKTNFNQITNHVDNAVGTTALTEDFLRRNENIIGKPEVDQTVEVNKLLGENTALKLEAQFIESYHEHQEESWTAKLDTLNQKLEAYGATYETERNARIWKIFKWSSIIALIIGIPIALMVCCPPFAGVMVGAFPILSHFFGIPFKVGSNMVRAIGDTRYTLQQQAASDQSRPTIPAKTYTATEVLSLIDSNLNTHLNNDSDQNVVDHLREVNNA